MAKLTGPAGSTGQNLTSGDHGRRHTSAQRHVENVLQASTGAQLELGQPCGAYIVVQGYRQTDCLCHDLA
jgi:hypothetical protein